MGSYLFTFYSYEMSFITVSMHHARSQICWTHHSTGPDAQALIILRNVRHAMSPTSRVLIRMCRILLLILFIGNVFLR
jgi:hypothetical protein